MFQTKHKDDFYNCYSQSLESTDAVPATVKQGGRGVLNNDTTQYRGVQKLPHHTPTPGIVSAITDLIYSI